MGSDLLSRNRWIISDLAQRRIAKEVLLFAGCGLGGNIAELSTRIGFKNFILIDGDRVTTSNLNRQVFSQYDLGENKASALAKRIKSINPKANISVYPKYFREEDVRLLPKTFDIVINTFDYGSAMKSLTTCSLLKEVPVLFPFNVGKTSYLLSITKLAQAGFLLNTPRLKKNDDFYSFLESYFRKSISRTMQSQIKHLIIISKRLGYMPQIGIASSLSSSLVTKTLIDLLSHRRVKSITSLQLK